MHTVFSHIIQKRFSMVNEDVATDALAYVLESSDSARRGMTKLLRGIVPDLPVLTFQTQRTEAASRPDMCGFADDEPRVFVENKFWAGLTDNQPISYLRQLAMYSQPSVLLVVAPAAREQALWRELKRRLDDAELSISASAPPAGVAEMVSTSLGPILALTSWTHLLSMLEHETVDDPRARGDLVQLRSLCVAADGDAFSPVSLEELSDHRVPALILQLGSIVQTAVDRAVTERVLNVTGLRPQANWERIGRYVRFADDRGIEGWIGIDLSLWKAHGTTPLWCLFQDGDFGRGREVRGVIEPWAARNGILTDASRNPYAIALDIPAGEEKDTVVRSLVDQFKAIATQLEVLPEKVAPDAPPRRDELK